MKKILKLVITVAIIVAIFFGVRALANNVGTGNSVYSYFQNSDNNVSLKKSKVEENLAEPFAYILSDAHSGSVKTEVKQSLQSGELYKYRLILQRCEKMSSDYIRMSALSINFSKDLQQKVTNAHKSYLEKLEVLSQKANSLKKLVQTVVNPNADDFESYFNDVVSQYKIVVKQYSSLCSALDNLVTKDVYNNTALPYNLCLNQIDSQMLAYAMENPTLIDDTLKMFENTGALKSAQIDEKLALALSNVDNLQDLLKAEDKSSFLDSQTNTDLDYIAQKLFNITKGA